LGTLLDIKPVLELENGTVEAVEQVRTKRKAISRLLDLVAEKAEGKELSYLGVSHASVEAEAVDLLERAQTRFNAEHTMLSELSPVIGTHAGPGTVVLAYMVAK
jgi:DegV family protein with EDD domain